MTQELERLAGRLRELAEGLRDPDLEDERAEELAREAADLAAHAGSEAERAIHAAAGEADE